MCAEMKVPLKPCPHCRAHGHSLHIETFGGGIAYIGCRSCFLRGPLQVNTVRAIEDWNALPRPRDGGSVTSSAESGVIDLGDVYIQGCMDGYSKGARKVIADLRTLALAAQSQNLPDLAQVLSGIADGNEAALPVALGIFHEEMKRRCPAPPAGGQSPVVDGGNVVQ